MADDVPMYWPDHARQDLVRVEANELVARNTWRLRVEAPWLAERIVPGQFLMVKVPGDDPLLGRPLALWETIPDAGGRPRGVEVIYLVQGNLTQRLATVLPGQSLSVWGPLGNGFAPEPAGHLVAVAGGIGQTPFLAVAREMLGQCRYGNPPRDVLAPADRVTLLYGARTADAFAGLDEFAAAGVEVRLSTDDGSRGHHGLVTDLLDDLLAECAGQDLRIVCCGPEPMMAAVAQRAVSAGVPCRLSLETPMACGLGICFSCVAKIRTPEGWDYRRTCVEGPVFDAASVVFD